MKLSIFFLVLFLASMIQCHGDDDVPTPQHIARAIRDATHIFKRTCKRATACVLQQEVTEGPYYYDTQLIRYNITEGHQGIPAILNLTVVNVNTCEPIANAAIDVWHCNASGVYSHYNNAQNLGGTNSTFLRGLQVTDSNGDAQVATIFPGWYNGRTTHIHIKVHIGGTVSGSLFTGGNVVHTGQLFFDDSYVEDANNLSPYNSKSQSGRLNLANDNIYQSAGSIAILDVSYLDSSQGISGGITASMVLGVDITNSDTKTTTDTDVASNTVGDDSSNDATFIRSMKSLFLFLAASLLIL